MLFKMLEDQFEPGREKYKAEMVVHPRVKVTLRTTRINQSNKIDSVNSDW